MNERPPNFEDWSDEDRIDFEIEAADQWNRPINDPCARVIAAHVDSPATPAIHTFVGSGEIIAPQFFDQVEANRVEFERLKDEHQVRRLRMLGSYALQREDYGPQADWSTLWVTYPKSGRWEPNELDDRCPACGAHVSEPHSPDCPLNPESHDEFD